MFENMENANTRDGVANYLAIYSSKPFTKSEMTEKLVLDALKEVNVAKLFTVKRHGKDRNPMFWSFGKIHGLENIAFADPEEIKATNGNPVKI